MQHDAMGHGGDSAGPTLAPEAAVEGIAVFRKYHGWPELKEAFMSGRLKAAYILAPMVMDLADQGIPIRIVALGHRSGAVIMVRKDSPARSLRDLRGKRVAIPSRFAMDHLYVRRLMRAQGLAPGDLELVEVAPPDMPAALLAGAVEAYATGEPFGGVAEMAGYARVLHMTRDDWPNYICCVLAVRDELITSSRSRVQQLVNYVLASGAWLDAAPEHRMEAARIAAQPEYFNQDQRVLEYVLTRPIDRVVYRDLGVVPEEFEELMQLSVEAGILRHPVPFSTYADPSFTLAYRRGRSPGGQ